MFDPENAINDFIYEKQDITLCKSSKFSKNIESYSSIIKRKSKN